MGQHTPYKVKHLKYSSTGPSTSNLLRRRSIKKKQVWKTYKIDNWGSQSGVAGGLCDADELGK